MYEIRQLEIPDAFLALYVRHSRIVESRTHVEQHYAICDELAHGVAAFCRSLAVDPDLDAGAILQRCHAGLRQTPQVVSPAEADWVTGRSAELLEWAIPTAWIDAAAAPASRVRTERRFASSG